LNLLDRHGPWTHAPGRAARGARLRAGKLRSVHKAADHPWNVNCMGAASHAGRDKVEAVGGKRAEQKVQVAGRAARALAYLVEQIRTNLLEALVICDVGACISRRRDRLAIQRYLDLDFSRGVRRLRAAAGTAADVSVREEPVTNEGVIRSAVWLELGVLMVALRTVSP